LSSAAADNLQQVSSYRRRVARWHSFKPKIQIWVNFGGPCNGTCWYILRPFVNFVAIWYILWPFGIFYCYLFYFPQFGMLYQEKSGNPGLLPAPTFRRQYFPPLESCMYAFGQAKYKLLFSECVIKQAAIFKPVDRISF
jgi:hypothetical protein